MKKSFNPGLLSAILSHLKPGAFVAEADLQDLKERLSASLLEERPSQKRTAPLNLVKHFDQSLDSILRQDAQSEAAGSLEFRLLRRSTPVSDQGLPAPGPNWSIGLAPVLVLGPFKDLNARPFWYELFVFTRQVTVTRQGEAKPFLSVPIPITGPALRSQNDYVLDEGSAWIALTALGPKMPGLFAHLRISGGTLSFRQKPMVQSNNLRIGAQATCTLTLQPAAVELDDHLEPTGEDAAVMNWQFPKGLVIEFQPGLGRILKVEGELSVSVFGESYALNWNHNTFSYNQKYDRLLIPMDATPAQFEVQDCRSQLVTLSGAAPIWEAAWSLPATQIDLSQSGQSKGAGGAYLRCGAGLQMGWDGLQNGPLALLEQNWLLDPGSIFLDANSAGKAQAEQQWQLWENTKKSQGKISRAQAHLMFPDMAPAYFFSIQSGQEYFGRTGILDAHTDKPIASDGMALSIEGFSAWQWLSQVHETRSLLISGSKTPISRRINDDNAFSIVLRNALFKVQSVQNIALTGTVVLGNTLTSGHWQQRLPLQFAVPTLPDPYVTNFALPDSRTGQEIGRSQFLDISVKWETPEKSVLDFELTGEVNPSTYVFRNFQNEAAEETSAYNFDETPNRPPIRDKDNLERLESLYRRWIPQSQETSSLLDVSGNADRWGVEIDFTPFLLQEAGNQFYSPVQVKDLNVLVPGRRVRAYLLPQIQWEPLVNIPNANAEPFGFPEVLRFEDDGFAALLGTQSLSLVPTTPAAVTDFTLTQFNDPSIESDERMVAARFTLPFGMLAAARFTALPPVDPIVPQRWDELVFNQPAFSLNARPDTPVLSGGLQIQARSHLANNDQLSPYFEGQTIQLTNGRGVNPQNSELEFASALGMPVTTTFNEVMGPDSQVAKVPLERYDFAGYGASIFSHWENLGAKVADVSQAFFNVMVGRTALEVVQIKSILFPCMASVVRTITIERKGNAIVTRFDSGWQALSAGLFDPAAVVPDANDYIFHKQFIHGIHNISNIRDTGTLYKKSGIAMSGVYYDGDIEMSHVESGGTRVPNSDHSLVPTRGQFGYVQLTPTMKLLDAFEFKTLLDDESSDTLGGPVNCVLNIGGSGQKMRVNRVDVGFAANEQFVCTARGALTLPNDGAWSIVRHNLQNGSVTALEKHESVPLVQQNGVNKLRIADPGDLLLEGAPNNDYGLLQSTGSQKVLFPRPSITPGNAKLNTEIPLLADALRLCKTASLFPDPDICLPLDNWSGGLNILEAITGLQGSASKTILNNAAERSFTLYEGGEFKLYIDYEGKTPNVSDIEAMIDSAAASPDRWKMPMGDVSLKADLWIFKPLLIIRSDFEAQNGALPSFKSPQVEFGPGLQPFVKILQMLAALKGEHYADAFKNGLDVAMSNSPDSWDYRFHAKLDLPLLKFPPDIEPFDFSLKTPPVILEVGLRLGIYYNERFQLPGRTTPPVPSHGGYVELTGIIHAQILTLAVVAAYAIGQVTLGAYLDAKSGDIAFRFKTGFGVEIIVSIPCLATVSVSYMVGIDFIMPKDLDSPAGVTIGGFLQMRGRVELLGGIVTAELMIEATGYINTNLLSTGTVNDHNRVALIATLTFGVHVSIAWVVDVNIDHSWQETIDISDYLPNL